MMRGQCPKCGKFLRNIAAVGSASIGLVLVTGVCKRHKTVDITNQDYGYDDFFDE